MTFRSLHRFTIYWIGLTLGTVATAFLPYVSPILASTDVIAQADTVFPDIQNYWGQPFIRALAERDIVTGYLDNTFRPEQAIARDEFAAVIRKAFSQSSERQISSGAVYTDIPEGYWAAPAIQEAYEMGFMQGYPSGEFRPNQNVTKTEVLSSLADNLDLPAPKSQDVGSQIVPVPAATTQQPTNRRRVKRPLMFPLAMTVLMQPLVASPAAKQAQTPAATNGGSSTNEQPTVSENPPQRPDSLTVSDYYQDAAQISQEAIEDVARTTAAGIIVNHPNPQVLNPNEPATRGEVAALIHQALVYQGKIEPLPTDEPVTNYIVGR